MHKSVYAAYVDEIHRRKHTLIHDINYIYMYNNRNAFYGFSAAQRAFRKDSITTNIHLEWQV